MPKKKPSESREFPPQTASPAAESATVSAPASVSDAGILTVLAISKALRSRRFRGNSENDLQRGIELVFAREGIPYSREYALGDAGIVDFMVEGRIAVEVKVDGSPVAVARQLMRYADRPEVRELVLVTTKARLGRGLGPTLREKPIAVVELWTAFL